MRKLRSRIVAAYDSETSVMRGHAALTAYPILHQIGILDCDIDVVAASNVREHVTITMHRHTSDAVNQLRSIMETASGYIPVVMVHNLSFDLYPLKELFDGHEVKVIAKSTTKPIAMQILGDDGAPRMVIWDTLSLTGMSLERMGDIAGYPKRVGAWDYDLVRTPDTPLTDKEQAYAADDIYALFCYFGYFTRLNPWLMGELGLNVITKTGVVRAKRKNLFHSLRKAGARGSCGKSWELHNRNQKPTSDDELYMMQACNRGGLTFVASMHASVPFHVDERDGVYAPVPFPADERIGIYAYDANSQHPAQMLSHRIPIRWRTATKEALMSCVRIAEALTWHDVLIHQDKPFPIACEAAFRVRGVRLKGVFAEQGIGTLAESRFEGKRGANVTANGFADEIARSKRADTCVNASFSFGKLVSADEVVIHLTELGLFEFVRAYSYETIRPLGGYVSTRWALPPDYSLLSVLEFYERKNIFKRLKRGDPKPDWLPDCIYSEMFDDDTVRREYYQTLKADLNSLYGIEVTNEYKPSYSLDDIGIVINAESGIECGRKQPKTDYHYGSRIVGWSRLAQVYAIEVCAGNGATIINGDTDSIKIVCDRDLHAAIERELGLWGISLAKARSTVMASVTMYAGFEDAAQSVHDVGCYELEAEPEAICAAWNKAYALMVGGKVSLTIAGIQCDSRRAVITLDDIANRITRVSGFASACETLLGYNIMIDHTVCGEMRRIAPDWGSIFTGDVTDHTGHTSHVDEPAAMVLFPGGKTLGDYGLHGNRDNALTAKANGAAVDDRRRLLKASGDGYEVVLLD